MKIGIIEIILILLIGLGLGVVFKDLFLKIFRKIKSFWVVVPGFWWTVLILIILSTVSYVVIFQLSINEISLDRNISMANTIITLVFAIFIGYYAFLQVAENRAERNLEQGKNLLSQNSPQFVKAMYYYELAMKFKLNDFSSVAELLEIYLANNETEKFTDLFKKIQNKKYQSIIDKYDNLIIFYLKIAKECFEGNVSKAKNIISEAIKYVQHNPNSINPTLWNFRELKTSEPYKNLEVNSDRKKYIDNFILFITNQLDQSKKERFINGDFRLD